MHKSTYILLVLATCSTCTVCILHVRNCRSTVHVRCRVSVDQYIFQLDMPEHRHYEYWKKRSGNTSLNWFTNCFLFLSFFTAPMLGNNSRYTAMLIPSSTSIKTLPALARLMVFFLMSMMTPKKTNSVPTVVTYAVFIVLTSPTLKTMLNLVIPTQVRSAWNVSLSSPPKLLLIPTTRRYTGIPMNSNSRHHLVTQKKLELHLGILFIALNVICLSSNFVT